MVGVFILPPDLPELEHRLRRLRRRAQDPDETVRYRLTQVAADVFHWLEYYYCLVNKDFDASVAAVRAILAAERLRRTRQPGLGEFVQQFRAVAKGGSAGLTCGNRSAHSSEIHYTECRAMDEPVTAAEANRQFSRILREVRSGRSYIVTSHGDPVARIVPMGRDERVAQAAKSALLDRLASQPVLVVGGPWRRDDLYDE